MVQLHNNHLGYLYNNIINEWETGGNLSERNVEDEDEDEEEEEEEEEEKGAIQFIHKIYKHVKGMLV